MLEEIDIEMNTSKIKAADFLARGTMPGARAERLLTDWANVNVKYPAGLSRAQIERIDAEIRRLVSRYPEVFPALPDLTEILRSAETAFPYVWDFVASLQKTLRRAWDARDARHRDWYIFEARARYRYGIVIEAAIQERGAAALSDPPDLTPLEQAMYHFQRIGERARHCPNPECPAPYFLAAKKGQKYCSSKCSAPAQREQKRDWWRRNRCASEREKKQ